MAPKKKTIDEDDIGAWVDDEELRELETLKPKSEKQPLINPKKKSKKIETAPPKKKKLKTIKTKISEPEPEVELEHLSPTELEEEAEDEIPVTQAEPTDEDIQEVKEEIKPKQKSTKPLPKTAAERAQEKLEFEKKKKEKKKTEKTRKEKESVAVMMRRMKAVKPTEAPEMEEEDVAVRLDNALSKATPKLSTKQKSVILNLLLQLPEDLWLDALDICREQSYEFAHKLLSDAVKSPELLITENPGLKPAKEAAQSELRALTHKVTVSEGSFKCPRCSSTNTQHYQKQTRSADEPMTNKVTCNACGNKWKVN